MIVVYGGTSSGKSNIAENIAVNTYKSLHNTTNRKLYYLATMETSSQAAAKRIERHRRLREGKGFDTIEEELDMRKVYEKVTGDVVLLECVSNLVANVLFDRFGDIPVTVGQEESIADEIATSICGLDRVCKLVVVTNNVSGDYYSQDAWCDGYMRILGKVNETLATRSDTFIEIIAGRVNVLKGNMV